MWIFLPKTVPNLISNFQCYYLFVYLSIRTSIKSLLALEFSESLNAAIKTFLNAQPVEKKNKKSVNGCMCKEGENLKNPLLTKH